MNYYEALLESYSLLKKRKFKLSIKEQEEEAPQGKSDEEVLAEIKPALGVGKDQSTLEINKVKLWGTNSKNLDQSEVVGQYGRTTITITAGAGSQLRTDNEKADEIIKVLRGAGEDTDTDTDPNQVVEPVITPEQQQAQVDAEALDQTLSPNGPLQMEVDDQGVVTGSPLLPNYNPTTGKIDRARMMIRNILQSFLGEEAPTGVRGGAGEDKSITDMVATSVNLPPEKISASLQTANKAMQTLAKLRAGDTSVTPKELTDLVSNIKVDEGGHGILFNDLYLQYRSRATEENDIYRSLVAELNKEIEEFNKENCPDPVPEDVTDCPVATIDIPKAPTGKLLARRGLLLEHFTVINDLVQQYQVQCGEQQGETKSSDCTDLEKRLGEVWDDAMKQGTADEVQQMLKIGTDTRAGEMIASIGDGEDAELTQKVVDYLVNEVGIDTDRAWGIVTLVANDPSKKGHALAIVLASSKGFNQWTRKLDILHSEVCGGEGTAKGNKADICRRVTLNSFNRFKKELETSMTAEEKELENEAACAGDGVGLDNLGTVAGNEVEFGTEQKSLTELGTGRTKMGEGTNKRMSELCDDKMDQWANKETGDNPDKDFVKLHDERLDNCLNNGGESTKAFRDSLGKNKDGTPRTVRDAACVVQKKVNQRMAPITKSLGGLEPKGSQPDAGHLTVNEWYKAKLKASGVDKKKAKERKDLAISAISKLNSGGTLTDDEKKAVKAIIAEMEQAQIRSVMNSKEYKDKNGNLKGEGLAYMAYRSSLEAAASEETLKDVRGYTDSQQRVGLVNAPTYGIMNMIMQGKASISSDGGNTYSISGDFKTGKKKVMSLSMERGQGVIATELEHMGARENINPIKEPTKENLFLSFLSGQKTLIEKLIAQTT